MAPGAAVMAALTAPTAAASVAWPGVGANDKAGAAQNLLRWTSTPVIKETFVPPTDHR
jgi:hypothetical protein